MHDRYPNNQTQSLWQQSELLSGETSEIIGALMPK